MTDITELTPEQKEELLGLIADATTGSWVRESGEGWEAICCDDDQGNEGFIIAEFQGKDAEANRKFVQAANPVVLKALLDALEADKEQIKTLESRNRRLDGIINAAEKRIAELEEIATDYGMKFQKSQDSCKHLALLCARADAAESRWAFVSKFMKMRNVMLDGYEPYYCIRVDIDALVQAVDGSYSKVTLEEAINKAIARGK